MNDEVLNEFISIMKTQLGEGSADVMERNIVLNTYIYNKIRIVYRSAVIETLREERSS